jgi:hypothetical protein
LAVRRAATLPDGFRQDFHEILENLKAASRVFGENEHARNFLRAHLTDLVEKLKRESKLWASGEIDTDYDDFSMLTAWVSKLRDGDELLGMTDWDCDCNWWQGREGNDFLHANDIAIKQNAAIRRIFVYRTDEDATQEKRRLAEMEQHYEIGVDVKMITSSDKLSAGLLLGLRSQCVLRTRDDRNQLRGWLTYKVDTDDGRNGRPLNSFSANPQLIIQNERMLERIWSNATKYEPTRRIPARSVRETPRGSKR